MLAKYIWKSKLYERCGRHLGQWVGVTQWTPFW